MARPRRYGIYVGGPAKGRRQRSKVEVEIRVFGSRSALAGLVSREREEWLCVGCRESFVRRPKVRREMCTYDFKVSNSVG
jgi:hypothetical protein